MDTKYIKLGLGITFDAIGCMSFLIPGIGEFSDIIWAPIAAWLMTKLYKGKAGRVGAIFTFIEEALPGFDIIPSFTLMWLYIYVFKTENKVIPIKH